MITGLLFDKDGTLFDFHLSWSGWAKALLTDLSSGDAEMAAMLGRRIGFDTGCSQFDNNSIVIAGTNDDIVSALLPVLPGASAPSLVQRLSLAAAEAPMEEAVPLRPLLSGFRERGLRLGVATNDSEYAARAHLDQVGILDLFDSVVGFDSGHGAKPGPGMCSAFAVGFGLAPSSVAMVGDSLHDLHAGRAAGMRTVGVLTGMAGTETLAPHADVVMENIGGLSDWMAGFGTQNSAEPTNEPPKSVAI